VTAPLFVAAGEGSGDALLAELIPELRRRVPDLAPVGVVGPRTRALGVDGLAAERFTGLGLLEVVPRLPDLARGLAEAERLAVASGARVALTVDSPDAWLRLAPRLRRRGIAVLHWVSPQVWAWRPGRVRTVAERVDAVLCVLPFEPAWYAGRVRAVFVGHPAAAIRPAPRFTPGAPRFALCPGSRESEVRALWPVFREVARELRRRWPSCGFVVPVAPTVPRSWLGGLDATYVGSMSEVAGVDAALTASGTATIQLAALDVPQVVAYRVHPLTAAIARRLLTVRHVALPNVLAGREVVPEHLQDLDPVAIARDLAALVGVRGQVPRELVDALEGEAAIARVADEVSAWLSAARPSGRPVAAAGS
jgi:lipid-A-disaccharide synthase